MDRRVASLVEELKAGLAEIYGFRLSGVYIYGSHARDQATPDSDLDVLVVLTEIEDYDAEIERTSILNASLSLKYAISVSRVFVSIRDWKEAGSRFLINARKEAVPA